MVWAMLVRPFGSQSFSRLGRLVQVPSHEKGVAGVGLETRFIEHHLL